MSPKVFDGVDFFIPFCVPPDTVARLRHVLADGGAEEAEDYTEASHIITNTDNFEGHRQLPPNAVVVTPRWVDRSVVMNKTQPTYMYSADAKMIFSGVTACAADDIPEGDREVLSVGITTLGGCWREILTQDVSHLFATTQSSTTYGIALAHREALDIKILLPHWFDESTKIGRATVDTARFEWPDPPFLHTPDAPAPKRSTKVDPLKKVLFKTASADSDFPLPKSVQKIWDRRRLLLSSNLGLTPGRRNAIETAIDNAGGVIVHVDDNEQGEEKAVEQCDYFITKYRSGKPFFKAARAPKVIGNLNWIFHVLSTGVITPPIDQLLHYPVPRRVIPKMRKHLIGITNYTGEGRVYLKKLIEYMGARFTLELSSSHTVLIAATYSGAKTEKAATWGIPIVNHLWLEDCFVKWGNVSMAQGKYIDFSEGVNYSHHLAEKGMPKEFEEAASLDREEAEDAETLVDRDSDDDEIGETSMYDVGDDTTRDALSMPPPPVPPKRKAKVSTSSLAVASPTKLPAAYTTKQPKRKRDINEDDDDPNGVDSAKEVLPVPGPSKSRPKPPVARGGRPAAAPPSPSTDIPVVLSKRQPRKSGKPAPPPPEPMEVDTPVIKRAPRKSAPEPDPPTESDVEDEDMPVVIKSPPKKAANRRSGRAPPPATKAKDETDDEEMLPPPPPAATPKRVPSVVVPTLAASMSQQSLRSPSPKKVSPLKQVASVQISAHEHKSTPSAKPVKPSSALAKPPTPVASTSAGPSASGRVRRTAATKATQKLHDEIMPDVMKHQQELKSKAGGRRSIGTDISNQRKRAAQADDGSDGDKEETERATKKSRISKGKGKEKAESVVDDEEEDANDKPVKAPVRRKAGAVKDEDDGDTGLAGSSKAKTPKRSQAAAPSTPVTPSGKIVRIMTTQVELKDGVVKALAKLGVKTTTRPSECTHLIAKNVVRTEKFLCALAVAPYIVSESWATESAKAKMLLAEDEYILNDATNEKKFNFSLSEALARAKTLNGKLFQNQIFYVTSGVPIDSKLLKNIVTASGGDLKKTTPNLRLLDVEEKNRHVISCKEDLGLLGSIVGEYPIYSHELILNGALKQEVEWDNKAFQLEP